MTKEQIRQIAENRYPHTGRIADMIETRRNDFIEGYQEALDQEEWKNLYAEGLSVGIAMYKEKYETLLASVRELGGIKVDREGKI